MEEFQLPGFVAGKTLHCGNMAADLILQVRDTRQCIHALDYVLQCS